MANDTFGSVQNGPARLLTVARRRQGRRSLAWLALGAVALAGCGVAAAASTLDAAGPVPPRSAGAAPSSRAVPEPAPIPPPSVLQQVVATALWAPPPRPAPPQPPPPRHYQAGRLVRIMFIGDSVAETTAAGLGPLSSEYGGAIANEGIMGCGVVTASPYVYFGQQSNLLPQCLTWQATWQAAVARNDPDVAAILVGRWELMDRFFAGHWTHVGDPAYDAYIESQLEQGIAIAASHRAKVALLTAPYFLRGHTPTGGIFPEDDPARVDTVNALIRQVAARHPGLVTVIDFGAFLSPAGHFTMSLGPVQVRSDGVHMTPQLGPLLAPWLVPKLVAIGQQA